MAKSGMTKHRKATSIAITALLLGLGGCNMYVIDFENKLPDGSVLAPKAEMTPPEPVDPIAGSDAVAFMDSTTAQLEGCRVITGMRISHDGTFDDGLVKLRNTAVRINANRIIPLRFIESTVQGVPHRFNAKMVRCPDIAAQAEEPNTAGQETNNG
ncbi:MAG: hypothetical protein ACON4I_11670 [Candidatus Puniceispirillaceae bacterium]